MNMTTWWLALALMLLCEGALIGIAPAVWRRTMRQLGELPDSALRRIGLGMAATAILIVALLLWPPLQWPANKKYQATHKNPSAFIKTLP